VRNEIEEGSTPLRLLEGRRREETYLVDLDEDTPQLTPYLLGGKKQKIRKKKK
jgi:hypothetical protein